MGLGPAAFSSCGQSSSKTAPPCRVGTQRCKGRRAVCGKSFIKQTVSCRDDHVGRIVDSDGLSRLSALVFTFV